MADNVAITAGTGTTIATDDIGGTHFQRVKIALGADGSAVDAVAGAGSVGTGVQRVTLASDDPAVTDLAAMEALLTTIDADTGAIATDAAAIEALLTTIDADTGAIATDAAAIEALLTTIDVDTGNIATDIATVDENINNALVGEYETVAASQTTQTIGPTGGSGDYLAGVLVIPATTSPGNVQIKDGSNSAITVFTGGTDSVSNLVPFMIPLGIKSTAGAWQVTTGANVSAIAIGNFT